MCVHSTHCRKDHGCKYNEDSTCPVALGRIKQEYECEYCAEDRMLSKQYRSRVDKQEEIVEIPDEE